MNIDIYLNTLLKEHDCVIIPHFGGFISNYQPAFVYSTTTTQFSPPKKSILFNKNLNHDDGLLLNHICKENGLNYPEAKSQLYYAIDKIIKTLKSEKEYTFESIGTFIINTNNRLQFTPNLSENYLTSSFGLTSFNFPVLNKDITLRRRKTFTPEDVKKIVNTKKIKRPVVFASILLAVAFVGVNLNENVHLSSFDFFSKINIEQSRHIDNSPTHADTKQAATEENSSVENLLEKTTSKQQALMYSESKTKFYLIAGCFSDLYNADKLAQELELDGFSPEIIIGKNMYRVSALSFSDKKDALNSLITHRKDKMKDLWIYSKNN